MRKNLLKISILTVLVAGLTMVSVVTSGSSEPVLALDPPINTGTPPTTFTVNITIANITLEKSLYAWDIGISFNTSILNATSVEEGPFLKDVGFTVFYPYIDNETGRVGGYAYLPTFPVPAAYGSGVLATITFEVIGEGKTQLAFYYVNLLHWTGSAQELIDHTKLHGWFLTTFTILGDIDVDGDVDSLDLELFASSYGKMFGDPSYNWLADLDRDGDVDSNDLHLLAQNYDTSV